MGGAAPRRREDGLVARAMRQEDASTGNVAFAGIARSCTVIVSVRRCTTVGGPRGREGGRCKETRRPEPSFSRAWPAPPVRGSSTPPDRSNGSCRRGPRPRKRWMRVDTRGYPRTVACPESERHAGGAVRTGTARPDGIRTWFRRSAGGAGPTPVRTPAWAMNHRRRTRRPMFATETLWAVQRTADRRRFPTRASGQGAAVLAGC